MRSLSFSLLSFFLIGIGSANATIPQDTVFVSEAIVLPPVVSFPVYKTDTTNMGGQTLDTRDFINLNATFQFMKRQGEAVVHYGDPLYGDAVHGALYALKFRVSTERYVKARLLLGHLTGSNVFVDGKKHTGEIVLKPGMTEIGLLCQVDTARRDTFDVALVGEHAAALCVLARSDLRPLTLSTMREGGHYGDVRLSPSGKYLITIYYDQSPEGTAEYWTVLTETNSGRTLAREMGSKNWHWLPTRDVIYYPRMWNKSISLVYRTPSGEERIVAEGLPTERFTLSPTEDYIIYTKQDESRSSSGSLRRLEQPDDRMSDWGKRGVLYRYDLRTGATCRLTFGRESVLLSDISPDGQRLLLSFSRMEPQRIPFNRVTLFEMDAYSGKVDTLLCDTPYVASAQYTSDGRSLLIKGSPDAFAGIGSELASGQHGNEYDYRLFRYDPSTHTATPLLSQFNASVDQVIVPLSGDNVYLTATESYGRSLWRLNTKSGKRLRYDLPCSLLQRVSIQLDGEKPTCVFYGQSGERSRDCFVATLGDKTQVRTERVGEVCFDSIYMDVALGICHDWKFRSSRGDSITGFYYLPANFDATKKYPLIVYYYGGCTPTYKTFEFLYPFTVLAAQGYVVYVVEPSGAIGFSQAFAARHVGTWGRESATDIIEGTRAFCQAHPYINAERIGCIGASYGGFMTQYLLTQTDLFHTAISHAGISNIASYWGGGYWGYTYGQVAQFGQYPWNNPTLYTSQSPLFNADKIHTPLLLLHGTADTNVPTNESQQMFTALRILGRPVSFVQVDGENHVVTNAKKQTLWQEAIFAWFAYHLKDQTEWWNELFPNDDFGVHKE